MPNKRTGRDYLDITKNQAGQAAKRRAPAPKPRPPAKRKQVKQEMAGKKYTEPAKPKYERMRAVLPKGEEPKYRRMRAVLPESPKPEFAGKRTKKKKK